MVYSQARSASGSPSEAAQGRAPRAARQLPRARHGNSRPACVAAARRGSQRGNRTPLLLEQRAGAEPAPSAEDSWETALLGGGGPAQRGPTAAAGQAPPGPSGSERVPSKHDVGPADELSDSERTELDRMAAELAAVEADRLGALWGGPGGAPQGLGFDADALLAAADAAERSRGSALGADAQPLKPGHGGGRRRAAGGQEPPEKEVPVALLPKVQCWPGERSLQSASICEHTHLPCMVRDNFLLM